MQAQMRAEFLKTAADARVKALERLALADQALRKEREREALRASVSGTVQDLSVHTLGGVVNAADRLLTLVPDDTPLELEAVLPNREAGFVHEGQHAEVKLEAFPFTRFGTVPGTVRLVSQEVSARPASTGGERRPMEARAGSDEGGYRIAVQLDRGSMPAGGRSVPLRPGMAAQADIVTGRRPVIAFLFDPIAERFEEAGHER